MKLSRIMVCLYEFKNTGIAKELTKKLNLGIGVIYTYTAELNALGLIENNKRDGEDDRRSRIFKLTKKGEDAIQALERFCEFTNIDLKNYYKEYQKEDDDSD
jgi:DNA-binding MarR family transcriptional regulator